MKFQTLFFIGAAAVPAFASASAAGWEAVLFYDVCSTQFSNFYLYERFLTRE
jgi:hypothetical protein